MTASGPRYYEHHAVDLLDLTAVDRVAVVGSGTAARESMDALRHRGIDVTALDAGPAGSVDGVDGVDAVVVSVDRPGNGVLREAAGLLGPRGQLLVAQANRLSGHGVRKVSTEPSAVAFREVKRMARELRGAGLDSVRMFGVLRTIEDPACAFLLGDPLISRSVVAATRSHVGGARGAALSLAPMMGSPVLSRVAPGWVLVARSGPGTGEEITGKIANAHSEEAKFVRGSPPIALERRYWAGSASNEVSSLRTLESVGFAWAPRVISAPDEAVIVTSWQSGVPLRLQMLTDAARHRWAVRAARVLRRLHGLTRAADGSVIVHGDYWLGNLLVTRGRITGVIDWTESRRGDDTDDVEHLIRTTAEGMRRVDAGRRMADEVRAISRSR